MDRKLLRIYLNDHLKGADAAIQLARRSRSSNKGTALAPFYDDLLRELESDKQSLQSTMEKLGVLPRRWHVPVLWIGVHVAGRMKLNGRIASYSPLSRLVELEALEIGATGKQAMWRALQQLADREPALRGDELHRLAERAEAQREAIERMRAEAAQVAFAG